MASFSYTALPSRVIFGSGTVARVGDEVRNLGAKRVLVLTTPQQAAQGEALAAHIGDCFAGLFCEAAMHTPVEVTERAVARLVELRADCVVAIGGGSTTGLAKAIAFRTDVPQIVIPTTYAGSETTPIIGQTQGGQKKTSRTLKVLPEVIIYDVDLTLSLPPSLSATSGMNAIAHAVEALYAEDTNPIISSFAEQSIKALASALPKITITPSNHAARSDALFGAWLAGVCLGSVGMSLHHKLCHTLGGTFDLPHADTHAVVLPHVVAYNASAVPDAMDRIARALDDSDAAAGLFNLSRSIDVPRSLRELGMPAEGIAQAAELAVANPYWNPRPVERDQIFALLKRAWEGTAPTISP
jgi:maleylacetate reductase